MSSPVKILCIAPYEGMKSLMSNLTLNRNDIDLDIFVGNLEKGVEIAQRNFNMSYDVIISRGGTAELISQITTIPVIEISLSVYDILRAIKLAENYAARYAIVGFPSITSCAKVLCDLLQYKIDIFTIHDENEVKITLTNLKLKGYTMVLCDMICSTTAKELSLNSILITSGKESIETSFDQAIKLSGSYKSLKEKTNFLFDVIQGQSTHTVIFDTNGNLFFSTIDSKKGISIENPDQLINVLKKKIQNIPEAKTQRFFKNISSHLYSITAKTINFGENKYAVFYITPNDLPASVSKHGVSYFNKEDVEAYLFNSFYNASNFNNQLRSSIDEISNYNFPVMLTGEPGTGKGEIVRTIFLHSNLNNHPLVIIDCRLINTKSWTYLTNHYNSPFLENNNTIFFKNIESLEENVRKQLLALILDISLHKRNRTIFSCNCTLGEPVPDYCMEYINILSCITLTMPPLRKEINSIPTLSSIYLGTSNVQMAKQIIGFEPEAMKLMESYNWPYNHNQLRRVLNELSLLTSTPYISADNVSKVLKKENTLTLKSEVTNSVNMGDTPYKNLDYNQTLNEINKEIIDIVLKKFNGNQSAAAKSLGISRTTLWRYFK